VRALLIVLLAGAGLLAGPVLRALIVRLSVSAGEPWRRACPACAAPLRLAARRPPRPRPAAAPAEAVAATTATAAGPAEGGAPAAPRSGLLALSPAGRCAGCGGRLGPPLFAVELTVGLLLGSLAARVHPGLVLAAACWLALCAIPLAFIDAAVRRLPDVLTGPAIAGTVLLLVAAAAASGQWPALGRAVLGGLALAGFCLVLMLISPSGMGLGDAKAAVALGTMLAWRSWTALIAGGFAGFLLAAVYGLVLLISGRATRKQQIPFGPFMITGAFLVILAGL
jgi:leader peptidase (prepilin peptidase) / N-methyltransferase